MFAVRQRGRLLVTLTTTFVLALLLGLGSVFTSSRPAFAQTCTGAAIYSPTPGSVLTGTSATFSWSGGTCAPVTSYQLDIGYAVGDNHYYSSGPITASSTTATRLPSDGSTVYVRLTTTSILYGPVFTDYTYTAFGACTAVTLTTSPASPQAPGTAVTLTGGASGCSSPLYQFTITAPGGSPSVVQAYSSTRTYTWNTTGLAGGCYTLAVAAHNSGASGTVDTPTTTAYTLTGGSSSSAPLVPALTAPVDEATNTGVTPTLSWQAPCGAVSASRSGTPTHPPTAPTWPRWVPPPTSTSPCRAASICWPATAITGACRAATAATAPATPATGSP